MQLLFLYPSSPLPASGRGEVIRLSDGKGQWKQPDRKRLLCQSARALALFACGTPIISEQTVKPVGHSLIHKTDS